MTPYHSYYWRLLLCLLSKSWFFLCLCFRTFPPYILFSFWCFICSSYYSVYLCCHALSTPHVTVGFVPTWHLEPRIMFAFVLYVCLRCDALSPAHIMLYVCFYIMFVFNVMPYLRLISCCLPLLSCLIFALWCLVSFRSLISASYYVVWLCISIFFFIWMPYLRLTLCFLLLLCFFLLHYVVCPWYTLLFLQSIILFTFLFLPFPHLMLCRFCLRFHALSYHQPCHQPDAISPPRVQEFKT